MKKALKIFIGIILIIGIAVVVILNLPQFGQSPKGERLTRIESSVNYQDGAFKNLSETSVITSDKGTFRTMLDFMFAEKKNVTPSMKLPAVKTNIKNLDPNEDVLVWFGHSSYYIQLHGTTFLVDPVFSDYASPFSFINKAFDGTSIYESDDMPEIDYLIISHDHWDHLDYKTVKQLQPKVRNVVCGLGVGQHFEYWDYEPSKIIELDWYESIDLPNQMKLTATPARHYSGRGIKRNQTLWASYAIQSKDFRFYVGGDSGYDEFYKKIGDEYGPFDLTILEQGQYSQNWKFIHLLPEEVFMAAKDLKGKEIFPVHNSKFALAAHPWDEPLNEITKNAQPELPIMTTKIGTPVYLRDSVQVFKKWWKN